MSKRVVSLPPSMRSRAPATTAIDMATGDWLTVVSANGLQARHRAVVEPDDGDIVRDAPAGVAELVDDSECAPVVERDVCGRCSQTARQVRLHTGHLGVAPGNMSSVSAGASPR
jgi:hypothetical protein